MDSVHFCAGAPSTVGTHAVITRIDDLQWRAAEGDVAIGHGEASRRPDGRVFLSIDTWHGAVFDRLATAMLADLPSPLYTMVDEADHDLTARWERAGLAVRRREREYLVTTDPLVTGLDPGPAPSDVTILGLGAAREPAAASGSDVKQEMSSENSSMGCADEPDSSIAARSSLYSPAMCRAAARLSSATTTDDLLDLARAVHVHTEAHDAVVITHGTDALEETAFLLALVHHHDAPVVVTGAQLPLDPPGTDGPANLATALEWACRGRPGVTVGFDGQIWPAIGIRKLHTTARRAFAVPGTDPVATTGPEGLVEHRRPPAPPPLPTPAHLPRVEVIPQYLGVDTTALDAAIRAGADGFVIAAFGDGNATPELTRRTVALLHRGVPVAVASRVAAGPIHGHYSGAGASLADAGALMASGLSPWQARLLLATAIAHTPDHPVRTAKRWLTAAEF